MLRRLRIGPRTRLEFILDTIWPIAVITLVVLKLAGVIAWSWWWVLSPLWGGLVLNVLAVSGLLTMAISRSKRDPLRPNRYT